jgi:2-haloacid dehalogenase
MSGPESGVAAVILDIGNVLIEWQPERFYDARFGEARRRALFAAVDLHAMNDGSEMGEDFHALLAETIAANPAFAPELAAWRDGWLDIAGPAIPRSVAVMRALRARGVPVHALTNFGVQTWQMAQRPYPFLAEFDRAFVSGHMGVIKPDPAIYAAVEAALDLPGDRLLFTDDRADNVAAAAARGWRTHLFEGVEGWEARLAEEGLLAPGAVA